MKIFHYSWQRCADPQISRPRIIGVRKHQVRGRSASATVMATHVRGPSASASRVGLHNAKGPTQSNGLSYIAYCSVQIPVLKLLRTGTLALPFQVGPANDTHGFRSADGPRPQIYLFGRSADRPQENLRIRISGYPRPHTSDSWH